MVPNSGIPSKVDAKAFNLACDELNVVYRALEDAQRSIKRTIFAAFCGGVIFGMFAMFVLGAFL